MVNNRQKTMKKIIVSIIIAIFIFSIGSTFMLYMFWNQVETNTNNQSRSEKSSNIGDNINLEFNNTENLEIEENETTTSDDNDSEPIENTSDESSQLSWTEVNEIENSQSN